MRNKGSTICTCLAALLLRHSAALVVSILQSIRTYFPHYQRFDWLIVFARSDDMPLSETSEYKRMHGASVQSANHAEGE